MIFIMPINPSPSEAAKAKRHGLVGPQDLWKAKRQFQMEFLLRMGLKRDDRLLDFGCGTLRGGIPLIEYLQAGRYLGVDVCSEVLAEGRLEIEESGLLDKEPKLVHCERLDQLQLGRSFSVAWAFQVLIHVPDAHLDATLAAVARHLEPDGVFYATVNVGNQADGSWKAFPVVYRSAAFYRETFRRQGLEVVDLGSLPDFGHVHPRTSLEAQSRQRMLKATRA
jgi:SAM-dependent methyltransferase